MDTLPIVGPLVQLFIYFLTFYVYLCNISETDLYQDSVGVVIAVSAVRQGKEHKGAGRVSKQPSNYP